MDLNGIVSELSDLAVKSSQNIQSELSDGMINSPEKMLKAQFALQQYSNYINFDSAIMKAFKDMIQGIISKI